MDSHFDRPVVLLCDTWCAALVLTSNTGARGPPSGEWADLAVLESARDLKAQHASILLTFDAVIDALAKAEATGMRQTTTVPKP
jgi:NifU-like protein involved in Fe-S cluster formation